MGTNPSYAYGNYQTKPNYEETRALSEYRWTIGRYAVKRKNKPIARRDRSFAPLRTTARARLAVDYQTKPNDRGNADTFSMALGSHSRGFSIVDGSEMYQPVLCSMT